MTAGNYARFYAPSFFFWTGAVLFVAGAVSLVLPLGFLSIYNGFTALIVLSAGILVSALSLLYPVKIKKSVSSLKLDGLMREYAFSEFHEVAVSASPEITKKYFKNTGVNDIPAVHFLMKIRGIADEYAGHSPADEDPDIFDPVSGVVSTPDFDFFTVAPDEWIMVMVLKSLMVVPSKKIPDPPEISTLEQFRAFDHPGYVKVAANFRFISGNAGKTILATETRIMGNTLRDCRIFGLYWRIIYPGSALIRCVWLNTIKKRSENER